MAQDIVIRVIDRDADQSITRRTTITVAEEDATCVHPSYSLTTAKTQIDLGSVVTANVVVVELLTGTPTYIRLYKDVTDFVLFENYAALIGAAGITALYLEAQAACTVYIYIAGATT